MVKRGRHDADAGKADYTQHIPRHGGPQTGTGLTPRGAKPKPHEVNIPGVQGPAARLARIVLKRMRGK